MDCTSSGQAGRGRAPGERRQGQGLFLVGARRPREDCEQGRGEKGEQDPPEAMWGPPTGDLRPEVRALDQVRKDEAGAGREGQAMEMGVGVGSVGKSRGGWGRERGFRTGDFSDVMAPGGSGLVAGWPRGLSLR